MSLEDPVLVKKILHGDQNAMKLLYQRHERYWFRLCLRYGRNQLDTQDILQEGLIVVFQDLIQYNPD